MRVALLAFGLLLLAACAPRLQEIGPAKDTPFLTEEAVHLADGAELPMRKFLPEQGAPRAIILALHGFNDYSKAFEIPGKAFAEAGIALFAYDQRGFGHTEERGIWAGDGQYVSDLKVTASLLKKKYPNIPLFLLGESMGGAIIMLAATDGTPLIADGLILSAPAIWGWDNLSPFSQWTLRQAAHIIPWVTVRPTGLKIRASSNNRVLYDLYKDYWVIKNTRIDAAYFLVELMSRAHQAAMKLTAPRYLMLYGEKEAVLPMSAIASMLHSLPVLPPQRQQLALYPNGYHLLLRDIDSEIVVKDILNWIEDPSALLPSQGERPPLLNKSNSNTASYNEHDP